MLNYGIMLNSCTQRPLALNLVSGVVARRHLQIMEFTILRKCEIQDLVCMLKFKMEKGIVISHSLLLFLQHALTYKENVCKLF